MIGNLDMGGSQSFVMNIYRKIDRKNMQFDFIIDHPGQDYYIQEIERLGGRIYVMPSFKGYNLGSVIQAWRGFFECHKEYKILHSHVRSYACFFLHIAKKFGLKTIMHSHSTSNGTGISAVIKKCLQLPLRFQADYFMACSMEAGKWLFGKSVIQQSNFYLIKNAIDIEKFAYKEESRKNEREKLGLKDEFVLGFLGRVTKPKNPRFVLEIYQKLYEIFPASKLLFVGDGDMMEEVRAYANELGISNHIIFTGAREDAWKFFLSMDAYVLPSLWEGLGMSLIEAQASGLICIGSENIPPDAMIAPNAMQMHLKDGEERWAQKIFEYKNYIRTSQTEKIRQAGFDIHEVSTWMQNFYIARSCK